MYPWFLKVKRPCNPNISLKCLSVRGNVAGTLSICLYCKTLFFLFFLKKGVRIAQVALNSLAAVVNKATKQENKAAMTSVRRGAGEKCACERVCKLESGQDEMWATATSASKRLRLLHAAFQSLSQVSGQARSVRAPKPDSTQRARLSGWFEPDDRNEIHS